MNGKNKGQFKFFFIIEAWPASTYDVHLRKFEFERISRFGGKGITKYPLQ